MKAYVFSQTITITIASGKAVASVTLPSSLSRGTIGVFTIAAG